MLMVCAPDPSLTSRIQAGLSAATGNQTTTYTYDGRGNLTSTSSGNGAHATTATYSYDAADRLTGATFSSGFSASYAYDADGRRVKQTVGTSVTNYLWDETSPYGDVVMETDGTGAVQASYVLGAAASCCRRHAEDGPSPA